MAVNFVASGSEGAHDPECDCRKAEAPIQGQLQKPALRGVADRADRLLISALSAELSRHRGAVPGARPGGRPQHSGGALMLGIPQFDRILSGKA